jgi:hypothetical protein
LSLLSLVVEPFVAYAERRAQEAELQRMLTGLPPTGREAVALLLEYYDPLDISVMPGADDLYGQLAERAGLSLSPGDWSRPAVVAGYLASIAEGLSDDIRITVRTSRMRRMTRRIAGAIMPSRTGASAGGHVSTPQRGFLSHLATGLGLVGAALIAFAVASMFGLAGYSGSETPWPAAGILLAPLMGLAGVIAALASRSREGGDGWLRPLEVNCAVMVVVALLLLLALV